MRDFEIKIPVQAFEFTELSEADRTLVESAKKATYGAYAPYSKFNVGAAVAMDNGEIVSGSNQENAAYPSGTCAERTTIFYASAKYPGIPIKAIAIAARCPENFPQGTPDDKCFQTHPISPCGACRQVLLEYEKLYGNIRVLLYGTKETYIFPNVASLLPYSFNDF